MNSVLLLMLVILCLGCIARYAAVWWLAVALLRPAGRSVRDGRIIFHKIQRIKEAAPSLGLFVR